MKIPDRQCFSAPWRRTVTSLLALLVAGGLVGCSTFERDWKAAASMPSSGLEGRWEGTWQSASTDHKDRLRCIVTRQDESHYEARFHAKYRRVFTWSFGYTVPMNVRRRDEVFLFEGEANLGWYAGGRYTYHGQADATNFFSAYRSRYDHGTFEMNRPSVAP